MFCPQCEAEYRVGFVRCSDCHVDLVDHLPVEEPARAPKARRMFDVDPFAPEPELVVIRDRKSTRLNSSHGYISYAVFCLKKKKSHELSAMIPFDDFDTNSFGTLNLL